MDLTKRLKKFRSTTQTARLVSNLLIFGGFIIFLMSIAFPLLPDLLATRNTGTEGAELNLSLSIPDWVNSWTLLALAIWLIWMGYVLKSLSLLAETQLIE